MMARCVDAGETSYMLRFGSGDTSSSWVSVRSRAWMYCQRRARRGPRWVEQETKHRRRPRGCKLVEHFELRERVRCACIAQLFSMHRSIVQ